MMEFNNLNKFEDKTKEDLINCEQKIEKWVKFMNDYKALEERLLTISDKTTHDIMVPIGGTNIAFMSGFIKHTNEILVLLGENYFVERSAKQAIDIVKRRLKNCQQMIEKLNEEKSQLNNWLSFSEKFCNENLVEIVEDYDEEKEKIWREEHRLKVRAYKQQSAQQKQFNDLGIDDKFDELEIEENKTQEKEFKSILKKGNNSHEESFENKSVSFDECEESVLITNEKESYPLPKFEQKVIKPELKTDIMSESKGNEVVFKSEVIERVIDSNTCETVDNTDNTQRIVSRFKANRLKK